MATSAGDRPWPTTPVAAQRSVPLAEVQQLKCSFSVIATGTWSRTGEVTNEIRPADLNLTFESIDAEGGTAEMGTASGNVYITARVVSGNLHLLRMDSSGPVYLTTVFSSESTRGRLKAAHSRHEFTAVSLPGYTSRPEQYLGECEPIR